MLGVEGGSTKGFLAGFSLESLIAPADPVEFLQLHWDRTPLLVQRGLPDFYEGLTSLEQIDAAVAASAFQMSSAGDVSEQASARIMDRVDPLKPNTDTFLNRMAQGSTLCLHHADRVLPGFGQMCRLLMVETGFDFECNLFATSADQNQGDARVGEKGAFVLQLMGARDWSYTGEQCCRPVAGERLSAAATDWKGYARTDRLQAGDLLYLPRGVTYAETALKDEAALHATFTIIERSWSELQASPGDDLAAGSALRDLLPIGFHRCPQRFEATHQLRFANADATLPRVFLEDQASAFRPDLAERFRRMLEKKPLSPDSFLRARKDLYWHIADKGEVLHLVCGPMRLAFPHRAEVMVRHLLTNTGRLGEIETELTQTELLEIAQTLVRHALLDAV